MYAAEEEAESPPPPDGPRDVPYPERENRMVTEHHGGAVEAGHHETVMMNDQDKR